MKTIVKTVFAFDDLSDSAKEKARQWYREGAFDYDWWEFVYEDAIQCAEIMGIEIDTRATTRMDGKPGTGQPKIYFSGFSSQGDGACFDGHYAYTRGAAKKIRQHAPLDKELHAIADALQEAQKSAFYRLSATAKQSGHYSHSGCMSVDVRNTDSQGNDIGCTDEQESMVTQCLRDFADWIYSQLEKEYDYMNEDEQVDESIRANEYAFGEDGRRAAYADLATEAKQA